jgi:ketosteroid isomerase-like protein
MKTNKLHWALLALPFLSLGACGGGDCEEAAELQMDSVKAEIAMMEQAYAAASNAKDVDGVAAYYADDAQSLADHEPTRVGMAAIKAAIAKDMEEDTAGHTVAFDVTGVWAAGNYATETGIWTDKDKDGAVVATGKYMTLFERRDGKYVAIRDIWNSDAPDDDEDADDGEEEGEGDDD